jgi:NAD(P)-dependent dehydrogenase (short-subunit alcohol dehydrogenase family)
MVTTGSNIRPGQALAVVVGAGALGMAIARRVGASHRVLLVDRDQKRLDSQVKAMQQEGHDAAGVVCDIVDKASVDDLAVAVEKAGPVRSLVHVAGLSPSSGDSAAILRVNLLGPALIANAFFELAQFGTAAVFITSLASHTGDVAPQVSAVLDDPLVPGWVERVKSAFGGDIDPGLAYQFSKYALLGMCQREAPRWGVKGARITSLSPGLVATPMGAQEYERNPGKYRLLESTPLGREVTMIEIADSVDFLLSDKASFISGVDLLVDGGLLAALRYPPAPRQLRSD